MKTRYVIFCFYFTSRASKSLFSCKFKEPFLSNWCLLFVSLFSLWIILSKLNKLYIRWSSQFTMDEDVEISDIGDMLSKNGFIEGGWERWLCWKFRHQGFWKFAHITMAYLTEKLGTWTSWISLKDKCSVRNIVLKKRENVGIFPNSGTPPPPCLGIFSRFYRLFLRGLPC